MDKIPRRKKKAIADTVPTVLLFITKERAHKAKRVREGTINAVEERGRSKWPR
jgi:hypothetical protein